MILPGASTHLNPALRVRDEVGVWGKVVKISVTVRGYGLRLRLAL